MDKSVSSLAIETYTNCIFLNAYKNLKQSQTIGILVKHHEPAMNKIDMMSKLSYSRIKRRKLFIGKQVAENLQILSHDALHLLMMQRAIKSKYLTKKL